MAENDLLATYQKFLSQGKERFLPNLSIDCVVFGFHENQLKVLLLKWKMIDQWCLPGGFILRSEHIDNSAKRILEERTSLKQIFLRQFQTFGDPQRSDLELTREHLERFDPNLAQEHWLLNRFVSIGYYALVKYKKVKPKPDLFSEDCRWYDVTELPELIMDHNHIVQEALRVLRKQVNSEPFGLNLMPDKFTMPELQRLYETIFGKTLDRRNFQKKMMKLGFIEKLEERKRGGAHKAPFLYRFHQENYQKALDQGIRFE